MLTEIDFTILLLLTAVLVADVGQEGVSPKKKRVMNMHLRQLFPDTGLAQRWAFVGQALTDLPEIRDGIAFLKLIEEKSTHLSAMLDEDMRKEVMLTLLDVAVGDGKVPEPVERVLRTVARPFGFASTLQMPD